MAAPPESRAQTLEKSRGRRERRTLERTGTLTVRQQWLGLAQGFRLRREITRAGKTTVEVVHGITSLPPERFTASRLLALTREHWTIENQLHYCRDVTLGEDACRVRTGHTPQVLAACRNTALNLLHRVMGSNCAAKIRRLAARPLEAFNLLFSSD